MQEPVAHGGLVDMARLGVGDMKWLIRAVPPRAGRQLLVERKDVILQSEFKRLNVRLRPLAAPEFPPGGEQTAGGCVLCETAPVRALSARYSQGTRDAVVVAVVAMVVADVGQTAVVAIATVQLVGIPEYCPAPSVSTGADASAP